MSVLLALALTQASLPSTVPAEDEIVVTARLTRIAFALGRDPHGKVVCRITQSSGDTALDDFTCRDLAKCVKHRKMSEVEVNACIAERKPKLAQRWLSRRGEGG